MSEREHGRPGAERGDSLPRVTYISWAESCSRSDHTARELGGRSYMVYAARYGSRPETIALKYVAQWRETAEILRGESPEVVFVMSPPVVAALPAFWYAWRHRARVVLDAHTGAFLNRRWRHLHWLQRWMCRRAATTIVHNSRIAECVHEAGGHSVLVPDVPIVFQSPSRFPRDERFTIAVVCSFNYDEPVAQMFEAAARVPDVRFFVTGNPKHLDDSLRALMPPNMSLTGFLSTEAYGGLLQGADAVLTLTSLDHTMLRGAYEAIYQGTPVIVSDKALLREYFNDGALHVDNSPEAIAGAIRTMQQCHPEFKAGALRLRDRKLAAWQQTKAAILERIAPPSGLHHTGTPPSS